MGASRKELYLDGAVNVFLSLKAIRLKGIRGWRLSLTKKLREKTKKFIEVAEKTIRPYQLDTTLKGLTLLKRGGFILKIPQGTGKSLISQMIIRHRLDKSSTLNTKALVIVPTIELRKQYARLAIWMGRQVGNSPGRNVGELIESRRDWRDFKEMVRTFPVLVATPKFFANRLEHMEEFWNQIDLCVLDEVDLWSILPIDRGEVRTHKYMETIFPELSTRQIPIVGLTGTPLTTETRRLLGKYGCKSLYEVPAESIGKFLPRIQIVPVPCADVKISRLSKQLTTNIKDKEQKLRKKLGSFDEDIYTLVMRACALGDSQAQIIRDLWGQRTQLHEDIGDNGPLDSTGKQKALLDIIKRESGVVVYAREVQMVEHLAELKAAHRKIGFAHAKCYRKNIQYFQSGNLDALIMTRSLGLRGLDFPDAKSMVLLSAKRDWKAMDQEMCRIRGQRQHRPQKRVYLFYYENTYEEEKVARTVSQLLEVNDDKFQRYSVPKDCKLIP